MKYLPEVDLLLVYVMIMTDVGHLVVHANYRGGSNLTVSCLQPGNCNTQVGAKRVLHLGNGRLYEELTAIDNNKLALYAIQVATYALSVAFIVHLRTSPMPITSSRTTSDRLSTRYLHGM